MAKFAKIVQKNNEKFLIKKFTRLFLSKIKNKRKGRFSFVLSGGKSPINLYKALSKNKKIPWKKIDFFIGDERFVNKNSKYSNIMMCKKYLLNKIKISDNQIYEIDINKKNIKSSTNKYSKKIINYFFNKKPIFDLILLGVGNDGHIASLFANNKRIKSKKNVIFVKRKDFYRITLTIKCINNAKSIFLWAPGKQKSKIINKILLDNNFEYPVSFLKKKNNFLFHCN